MELFNQIVSLNSEKDSSKQGYLFGFYRENVLPFSSNGIILNIKSN